MSELSVGSLSGLAANSYVIDVASGSSLDLSNATDLPASALPAGSILQVVSVAKTDTFTTPSGTFVDVTDFNVSITPSSTANTLLISYQAYLGNTNANSGAVLSFTNAADTVLFSADAAGSRNVGTSGFNFQTTDSPLNAYSVAGTFVHSPSTTSAFTVKGRLRASNGGIACFGRSGNDGDAAVRFRGPGSLVVMEVAG